MFIELESPYEMGRKKYTLDTVDSNINWLLNQSRLAFATAEDDLELSRIAVFLLDNYTRVLFELFPNPISANVFDGILYNNGVYPELWTFSSSMLFTSTTMVPVGFGLVTPLTFNGRVFLVIYALVGIPLAVVTISDIGRFFCDAASAIFGNRTNEFVVSLVCLVLCFPVVVGLLISLYSGMPVSTSIYYASITMLTIGFGDINPPIPIPFLIAYIVLSVTLVTVCVDVVAANLIHQVHFMGRQFKNAKELANKMVILAQKINIKQGLGLGIGQLGAFARFGLMKIDGLPHHSNGDMESRSTPNVLPYSPSSSAFDPPVSMAWIDRPSRRYKLSLDRYPYIDDEDAVDVEDQSELSEAEGIHTARKGSSRRSRKTRRATDGDPYVPNRIYTL